MLQPVQMITHSSNDMMQRDMASAYQNSHIDNKKGKYTLLCASWLQWYVMHAVIVAMESTTSSYTHAQAYVDEQSDAE
jgi:hypothetical protein